MSNILYTPKDYNEWRMIKNKSKDAGHRVYNTPFNDRESYEGYPRLRVTLLHTTESNKLVYRVEGNCNSKLPDTMSRSELMNLLGIGSIKPMTKCQPHVFGYIG